MNYYNPPRWRKLYNALKKEHPEIYNKTLMVCECTAMNTRSDVTTAAAYEVVIMALVAELMGLKI